MTTFDFAKLIFSSLLGIAAFSYYAAHIAEKGASDTSKQKIKEKLQSFALTPGARSAFAHFLITVDRYFGKAIFSWKAFSRSILFSAGWVTLILALCIYIYPNYRSWLGDRIMGQLILKSGILLILTSLLIDFLSVCTTRALIRWSLPRNKLTILGAAIADIFISASLFYVLFTSAKYLITSSHFATPAESLSVWINLNQLPILLQLLNNLSTDMMHSLPDGSIEIVGGLNTEIVYALPEGILFFSSLLTSIWMWLYVVAYWSVVSAVRIDRVKAFLKAQLNVEGAPFFAVAHAILVVAILVSCIAVVLFALLHEFVL